MTVPDVAAAVLRKWWVALLALAVLTPVALSLRATGAEFIADSWVTVTLPRQDNTLLDSADADYRAPAILASVAVESAAFRATLRDDGLPDTFEVDYRSEYPVVMITLRGPTPDVVAEAIDRVSDEYARQITAVQSERGVVGGAQVRGDVTAIAYPGDRAPGSQAALVGLLLGVFLIATALAYAADQFGPSILGPLRLARREVATRSVELGTPS